MPSISSASLSLVLIDGEPVCIVEEVVISRCLRIPWLARYRSPLLAQTSRISAEFRRA